MARHTGTPDSGPGVDAQGRIVPDPTENVLDLVNAAIKRQDDLREAESEHVREIEALRASYDEKLRRAESARIDAIRAVDVGAVQRAAEVSAIQAETLRVQVATTAQATAAALSAALEPLTKDIADLRRAQYEAQGQKTQVIDGRDDRRGGAMMVIAGISAALAFVAIVATVVLAVVLR